ncbi:Fucose mutarotase [Portunus trituberculatus]|uniref:L-fucose mutarotase n=1 Tax=Portunus trituberculatus TaxID=210409 RepID=A0A5B7CX04_PORTR|nr:Fucose mutarotase [Portunus trituberculatus]
MPLKLLPPFPGQLQLSCPASPKPCIAEEPIQALHSANDTSPVILPLSSTAWHPAMTEYNPLPLKLSNTASIQHCLFHLHLGFPNNEEIQQGPAKTPCEYCQAIPLSPLLHYLIQCDTTLQLQALLADINFPTHSICTAGGPKEYRADGLQIPALLDAILTLMPLDNYVDSQVAVMNRTHRDVMLGVEVPILNEFRSICNQHFGATVKIEFLERFEFYERAKKTYAIIQTGLINDHL